MVTHVPNNETRLNYLVLIDSRIAPGTLTSGIGDISLSSAMQI
jgi:hypothetical protein